MAGAACEPSAANEKGVARPVVQLLDAAGAGGRNRTDTRLPPLDFESSASTSFTTPAKLKLKL